MKQDIELPQLANVLEADTLDRLDFMAHQYPSGSGYKNVIHTFQLARYDSPAFARFDLGTEGNFKKYGQETPDLYNLS